MFPTIPLEVQKQVMVAAHDMISRNDAILDTLTACGRFKLKPKEVNIIVNYVVSTFKASTFYPEKKLPTSLTDDELMAFMQRLSTNSDLWLLPPIVQQGFLVAQKFLIIFGGRVIYATQLFVDRTPFSLFPLVSIILGNKGAEQVKTYMLKSQRMAASIEVPDVKQYYSCFVRGINRHGKKR